MEGTDFVSPQVTPQSDHDDHAGLGLRPAGSIPAAPVPAEVQQGVEDIFAETDHTPAVQAPPAQVVQASEVREDVPAPVAPGLPSLEPHSPAAQMAEASLDQSGDRKQKFLNRIQELSATGNLIGHQLKEENKQKVREYVEAHETVTQRDIEELCKVGVQDAARLLEDLEEMGTLVEIGRTSEGGRYKKV